MNGTLFLAAGDPARQLFGIGLTLATLLLLALPLALVYRLHSRLPERALAAWEARPWFVRFLGAANVFLVLLVSALAQGNKVLGLVAFALLIALVLLQLAGFTALATGLGRRMTGGDGAGGFALGWLTLSGVPLFPVFGWLAFLWFAAGATGAAVCLLRPDKSDISDISDS